MKGLTRFISCTLFVWVVLTPISSAAQERTARELVDLILREGPQARAIRAAVEVVRQEQAARRMLPNPTVWYTRESAGFTEFLQIDQSLPAFGLRSALQRAGVAAVEAAEAESGVALAALRAEAITAIARFAAESTRIAEAERAVREIEKLVEILAIREREGEGSKYDRRRAEQETHEARLAHVSATAAAAEARAGVEALLPGGVGLGAVSWDQPPAAVVTLEMLTARGTEQRSELRALERAANRFRLESEAARRARGVTPSFVAGLKRADDSGDRQAGYIAGAGLSIPLFDRGDREAARCNAEAARAMAAHAEVAARVRAEIAGAAAVLELRRRALESFAEASVAGEEIRTIADAAYQDGAITILELLDAYRTAARARARLIDLRLDAALALIALQRATGDSTWQ